MKSSSKGYKSGKSSSEIGRKRRSQPIIGFKSSSYRPNQIKFFHLNQSLTLQLKAEQNMRI